jgi:hypothetical protein
MTAIDQEPDRVPRGLIRTGAVVVAVMIIASVIATELIGPEEVGETVQMSRRASAQIETATFAAPTDSELETRRAVTHLRNYGWVDRGRGVIHVPLQVATELYLAEPPR